MYKIDKNERRKSAKCCTHPLAVVFAQLHVHDLAAGMTGGGHHHRDVQPGVAGEQGAGQWCFQQHIVLGARIGGQHLPADLLGLRVHHAAALLLFVLVDLLREAVGRGAAAAGVGEHMHLEEADLLQKLAAFLKIGLGLTREASDQRSTEHNVRDLTAKFRDNVFELLPCRAAAHSLKDTVACMLDRKVKIIADLLFFFHDLDQLIVDLLRITVELLLISADAMCDEVRELDISKTVILTEGTRPEELDTYAEVYKYQSSAEIVREVMAMQAGSRRSYRKSAGYDCDLSDSTD